MTSRGIINQFLIDESKLQLFLFVGHVVLSSTKNIVSPTNADGFSTKSGKVNAEFYVDQ